MKWTKVENEPPKEDGLFIVVFSYTGDQPIKEKQTLDCLYWYRNHWEDNCDHMEVNDKYWKVTHWMPLPDKPKT